VPITGIPPQFQVLRLFRSIEVDETPIAMLDDDHMILADYGVVELNVIKVDNTDPNARPGEFTDLSAVDKFELTADEYEARPGMSLVSRLDATGA
jgi:tubulin-folding cofactor B